MSQMKTLKRVLRYIRHYLGLVGLSIALATLTVALTLYVPVLTGQAIDGIIQAGQVDFQQVTAALWRIGLAVALTGLAQWLMNVINNRITYDTVRDIRAEAFRKLQRLPLSYLDQRGGGQVVSRLITDVDQFADGLLMGFNPAVYRRAHHRGHPAVHGVDQPAHRLGGGADYPGVPAGGQLYRQAHLRHVWRAV